MAGFLSRIFGGGKKKGSSPEKLIELVGETLQGIIERADLELTFDLNDTEEGVLVELSGADAELLKEKEGQLIDAFQFLMKRVVQHQFPEDKTEVIFDSNGYREESNQALVELAERLKSIVIEKNKSVYFRALPPKDRKIVHQYLAGDERVKSKSIGEGLYKKIKIFPAQGDNRKRNDNRQPRGEQYKAD